MISKILNSQCFQEKIMINSEKRVQNRGEKMPFSFFCAIFLIFINKSINQWINGSMNQWMNQWINGFHPLFTFFWIFSLWLLHATVFILYCLYDHTDINVFHPLFYSVSHCQAIVTFWCDFCTVSFFSLLFFHEWRRCGLKLVTNELSF